MASIVRHLWTIKQLIVVIGVALIAKTTVALPFSSDRPGFEFHDTRQGDFAKSLNNYEISIPRKVTEEGHGGHHISHSVRHLLPTSSDPESSRRRRWRRDLRSSSPAEDDRINYSVTIDGKELHLDLVANHALFAPGLVVERRDDRAASYTNQTYNRLPRIRQNRCHFNGHVRGVPQSTVAMATCDGLHGFIHIGNKDYYFIEPVRGANTSEGHPHLIYKRSSLPHGLHLQTDDAPDHGSCGVQDTGRREDSDRRSPDSKEQRSPDPKERSRRQRRSISLERNVETLVVVDQSMVEYYKNEDIETYVLTIMNMVSTMYHESSIGNAVNIVLVRIVYLEGKEEDLKITHHADHTLASFCKWQMSINPKDEKHPNHHDVAVLMTRINICSRMNEPCSTLGLSQVSGMCQQHRSCNINEDTGLAMAFTVAHELGHNFGMQHDTAENGCDGMASESHFVMSPQLTIEASPLIWSNCSRRAITAFLDRGWGHCLDDQPSEHDFDFPVLPPGVMYDIDHQCRLQYGPEAEHCKGIDDPCSTVWCRVDKKCLTRLEAAAEGTLCENNEWCFGGRCVTIGDKPLAIDSHWGEWASWSDCSRTCGAGISHSERLCNNPPPSHGGRYCLGERRRYRVCNTDPCPEGNMNFREQQCAEFNNVPHKGYRYEWEPVASPATPCQLHCKPKNRFFSVMLRDMVVDGTQCTVGRRDMCIAGRCRVVGCDWGIESDAKEDHCGVCHGDGTTCKTVKENFNKESGLGYVDATMIPEGARNIRVHEVAEANNYLAIRSTNGQYYLNGHWFIQWSGDYEAAGTVLHYKRDGNKESVEAPGPIKEPLYVVLLFQSQNPGVKLEYTIPNENITEKRRPEFHWKFTDWTHCTLSCGGGSQRSEVVCVEKEAGIVDDIYCNITTKPDDMHKSCNEHLCPARWWTGPWQHCSVSCGDNGVHKRTVLCVRQLGPDEQSALEDWECDGLERPLDLSFCRHKDPCPAEEAYWKVGAWSQCTRTCNGGIQFRSVSCVGGRFCAPSEEPVNEQTCNQHLCSADGELPQMMNTTKYETTTTMKSSFALMMSATTTGVVGSASADSSSSASSLPSVSSSLASSSSASSSSSSASLASSSSSSSISSTAIHEGTLSRLSNGSHPEHMTSSVSIDSSTYDIISSPLPDGSSSLNMLTNSTAAPHKSNTKKTPSDYRWMALFWSECSKLCGSGYRTRKVMCIHIKSKETVPDEYCSSQTKSAEKEACQKESCIAWTTGAWQQCSSSCGEGLQTRHVSCSQSSLCDTDEKPIDRRICDAGPCVQWSADPWQECSKTCGSGVRNRRVTCVNGVTQLPATGCDVTSQPDTTQQCNTDECPTENQAVEERTSKCSQNLMSDVMCSALQRVGRCSLEYVQRKCCLTCLQRDVPKQTR